MIGAVYSKLFLNPIMKTRVRFGMDRLDSSRVQRLACGHTLRSERMMHRGTSIVAVLLILCIMGISGIAPAQSVLHESHHHTHHQAATHGSAFCSWMCAAGQAGEAATVLVPLDMVPLEIVELFSDNRVQRSVPSAFVTRGPPVSSTI